MSDPLRVIAGELDGAEDERLLWAEGILIALSEAGHVVVPVAESRVEWGLRRNWGDIGSVMPGFGTRDAAEFCRDGDMWKVRPTLVSRINYAGPWEPVL